MISTDKTVIEQITKTALDMALDKKYNNKLRFSKFTSNIGNQLFQLYSNSTEELGLSMAGFDQKTTKNSESEWMLDIAIAKRKQIFDPGKRQFSAIISHGILWAVKVEANPELPAFARGFGNLLCASSVYYLYLNGINQLQETNRNSYIERRLELARELLKETDIGYKKFYYTFWPSPDTHHAKGKSFWDLYSKDELLNMVKVFDL